MPRRWPLLLLVTLALAAVGQLADGQAIVSWHDGDDPALSAGGQGLAVVATSEDPVDPSRQRSATGHPTTLPPLASAMLGVRLRLEGQNGPSLRRHRGPDNARAPPSA